MAKSLLALALGLVGGTCNRGPLAFLSGGLRSAGNAHANGLSQAGKGPPLTARRGIHSGSQAAAFRKLSLKFLHRG